jgi:hypothetical protein
MGRDLRTFINFPWPGLCPYAIKVSSSPLIYVLNFSYSEDDSLLVSNNRFIVKDERAFSKELMMLIELQSITLPGNFISVKRTFNFNNISNNGNRACPFSGMYISGLFLSGRISIFSEDLIIGKRGNLEILLNSFSIASLLNNIAQIFLSQILFGIEFPFGSHLNSPTGLNTFGKRSKTAKASNLLILVNARKLSL